ncbi:MAG: hypothetical protein U9Q71_09320 [Pseudomonadota bacterium]|nr:hypothetical protein [Pseudomonadota bacterium]
MAQPAWPQAAANPSFPRVQGTVPRQAPAARNIMPWGQPQWPGIVQAPPRQPAGPGGLFSMFRPAPAPAPVQQRPSAFSWLPVGNRAQTAPRGYNPYAAAQRPSGPTYNPLSGLNPLNALNSLQVLNPLSALNPGTAFNPLKALNPVNAFNPLYALNPVNSFNPLNALNPVNAFNPMYLMNPLNALNTLNALNPGNQVNPLQRLNPLNAVNPLNGLAGLSGKYAMASLNATTLKNLLGMKSRPTQRSPFGFGAPPAAAYRPAPPAPTGGGFNPFSTLIPGFVK